MSRLKSKDFWDCALARALRTTLQGMLIGFAGCATIESVNWQLVGSSALMGFITSLITSIITGLPEAEEEDNNEEDN